MQLSSLVHLIGAASSLTQSDRVIVLGSAALLANSAYSADNLRVAVDTVADRLHFAYSQRDAINYYHLYTAITDLNGSGWDAIGGSASGGGISGRTGSRGRSGTASGSSSTPP